MYMTPPPAIARQPAAAARRLLLFAGVLAVAGVRAAASEDWPQFRGPSASGVGIGPAPLTWDIESGSNVVWQTSIPGLGHASPIIRQGKVYVATAVKPGGKSELKVGIYGDGASYQEKQAHQWRLLCLEQATGKVVWDKLEHETVPRLERHTKASHCNSTPATDGRCIAAILGSEGLFCFDMDGALRWSKDLGKMDGGPYDAPSLQWGFASSPVLHEGKVIVQCDVLSEQFLAAYDTSDGHQVWRTARHDVATWSTPLVVASSGRNQVVANGWKEIAGYDLATGHELWRLNGGGDVPVASPIRAGDFIIQTSGHGSYRPMRALRPDATGDITPPEIGMTNQAIVWCHPRQGNYLQTPITVGGLLWGCSNDGIVTCFDTSTGKIYYNERIGGGGQAFTASPVAADGKLYFTGERGDVFVLAATNRFTVLQTNRLGSLCLATPVLSDGKIFFRTVDKLLAIGRH
jgi:outer membrane protein assembly factor BamB